MDFWTRWTGIVLVVLALVRAVLLVAHEPMAGYANAGAMDGTAACVGLAPADEAPSSKGPTSEAPIETYRAGSPTAGCYWSVETAFVGTVVALARTIRADTAHFQLRWIGYAKLALLFLVAFAVAFALRDHPAASVVHGLVVLLVLADPVVTLWLNTLYREFFAIWALYAAIAGACLMALTFRPASPWVLLLIGLPVLAFAREHDALLGIALVVIAWPWLWTRSQRLAAVTAVIAIAAWIGAFVVLQREAAPRWPSSDVVQAARSAVHALPTLQHAAPAEVGTLSGPHRALHDLPPWGFSPIEAAVAAMPPAVFAMLQLATLFLLPLAFVALVVMRRKRGDPFTPLLLGMILGAVALHAAAIALYAAPPAEVVPRYLTAILAMSTAVIGTLVGVPIMVKRWIAEPRDIPLELGVGAATVGAGLYACVLLTSS